MLCRKCQTANAWANGLCRNCHNQYYYSKKAHGLTLKQFITGERKTYYKVGGVKFDKFVEIYEKQNNLSKTELAKRVGVSRETLYKYIEQYKEKKQV